MVSDHDIELVKLYFEHLIQCVVGCGCWEPGWDDAADVRKFAHEGFVGWVDAPSPADVLAALVRLDAIEAGELARASQVLELRFEDVDALRAFWAPSIAVLRAELGGAAFVEASSH
jgi:hypothetical protein